jgi:hypothetical protein
VMGCEFMALLKFLDYRRVRRFYVHFDSAIKRRCLAGR